MLNRDKRVPLDTWILSEPQGNVFGNPRPVIDSSQTPHQGMLHSLTQSAAGAVPVQVGTGQAVARGEERIGSTATMSMSERRPSTMHSFLILCWTAKTTDIGTSVWETPTPSSFVYWKIRFKTEVSACSDFPLDAMLWMKEVEMVDSVDELKSSRSIAGKDFPNFELFDARTASSLNKIIQNSDFKKKVSLEEQKAQRIGFYEEDRSLSWSTTIFDLLEPMIQYWITLTFSLSLFSMLMLGEFDTRWDEVLLSMTKIPSDDCLESLHKLRIHKSDQLKTVFELYDKSKDIDAQLSEVEDDGEKEHRSETSISKFRRQKRENWDRSSGYESQEIMWCWKRKRFLLLWKAKGQCSRKDHCIFRHESHDQKPTPKAAPSSEPPTPQGRCTARKRSLRGRTQSGKSNRQPCKNFLKGTCTELPCDYWHPPECQFYESETGCKFGADWKVEEQPNTGRWAARICNDFSEGQKSFGTKSTSTIHKSCAASSKHQRKRRLVARKNSSQNFSSAQSLR